jgi:cytochrome P450
LQSYGEAWRKQRRFVSHEFSQSMVPRYYELQEAEAITLVHNLIKDPASFISELKL